MSLQLMTENSFLYKYNLLQAKKFTAFSRLMVSRRLTNNYRTFFLFIEHYDERGDQFEIIISPLVNFFKISNALIISFLYTFVLITFFSPFFKVIVKVFHIGLTGK